LPDFDPWASSALDDGGWPWFEVRLAGELVATHAASGRAFLVVSRHPWFGSAEARLEVLSGLLEKALPYASEHSPHSPDSFPRRQFARAPFSTTPSRGATLRSNMSDADYGRAFDRLHEYLRAGDLYQANLTRRFEAPCLQSAGEVYARLRSAAPAPYSAWLATEHGDLLSASPELFLARQGDRLVTRPIKGTRPRRAEASADAAEATELQASAKDRAEHVMIVDVHRNDLGRVCEYGSVHVEKLAALESFPTVHHLTSTVVGTPRGDVGPWQAISAAFPAGSITGAPKRRAIEVIEELEPTRRAFYCGSIGWIGFDGDFALNVAIRTILLAKGSATFQAGGGIVIDSRCDAEAEETWNKARALYAAIDPEGSAARERAS
jgi:aminodeoxychorismate synthase component I